ncbi:MAG: tRNA (adenosine(37)-N6)-threonylcarbamoyltransferase complex dimerization subunit type 1 TsaB [Gemmatimonadota bacterium]
MRILAIDTATFEAGVALHVDGRVLEGRLSWRSAFRESAPAMEALLDEAGLGWSDLDGLAVPAGPGSFTGLRVGAAMALAIAEIGKLSLFAASTLAVVAEACARPETTPVCASLDARRGRRYVAVLERDGEVWAIVRGPVDIDADRVRAWAGGVPHVQLEKRERGSSPAAALAALAARAPDAYRLSTPGALQIAYARPPTEVTGR